MRAALAALLASASLAALGACSDSSVDPGVTPIDGGSTFRSDTIDTRNLAVSATATKWVYVSLSAPNAPLALTDAAARTSAAWDIAFNGFSVKTNGGSEGPGGVSAYCLCQNTRVAPAATATAFFSALTSAGELADFTAVTRTDIPADTAFRADSLLGLSDWYRLSGTTRTVSPYVYSIARPAAGGFAKLQVTGVGAPTSATGPGTVSFQYATRAQPTGSAFAAARTATVAVPATGTVYFSFTTGAPVTASDAWDLAFEGWRIRTNSGVSATAAVPAFGAYNLTLGLPTTNAFDAVLSSQIPPTANGYRIDGYGLFTLQPLYYYDRATNTALPTHDVFLVKRGASVYKIQVTGFRRQLATDPAPLTGFIALRSARIAG